MSIQATWIDENYTSILVDFVGQWTWEDLRDANEKKVAMLKSVSHIVDTVNDLTHSGGLPNGALTEGRSMTKGFETSDGLNLVIQAGALAKSLYIVFQKLYGRRAGFPEAHFFESRDDALLYLQTQRVSEKDL